MDIDVECEGRWLLEQAGFDISDVPSVLALARRLLGGEDAVRFAPAVELWGDGEVRFDADGRWRIYIRDGLTGQRRRFAIAHELAEWHLAKIGYVAHWREKEDAADGVAACVLAPRDAFRAALRCTERFDELAIGFGSSESMCALRFGEVTLRSLLLIAPGRVRARGADGGWPIEEQAQRALAREDRPGLRRTRLSDPGRFVVMADAG